MAPLATRAFAAAALAALLAVAAQAAAPAGVRPLGRSSCGPIQNPAGKHLIASDLPLQGAGRAQTTEMVQAIKFALKQRNFKAGSHNIGYQSCDESTAQTGDFDVRRCAANAYAYAHVKPLVAVIGPWSSFCAQIEFLPASLGAPGLASASAATRSGVSMSEGS